MNIRYIVFLLLWATLSIKAADSAASAMILIPSGTFNMGSVNGAKDERPVHRVQVDSFYLGATEVTIWEYLTCVQSGNCRMPYWWNKRFFPQKADELSGKDWLNLPVTGVSWDDAQAYCRWLGQGFRLPTEAEWEYAARGGTQFDYFWGNTTDSASKYAVINDQLSPIMTVRPNPYGLYDMLGNAWEWCGDRYDAHYYKTGCSINPVGPVDSARYPYRVVRGGSWNEYIWNLRSANRNYGESSRRFDGVGFRICRSVHIK
jgi:formylglycine-generating enzyme required for sulfatase activity